MKNQTNQPPAGKGLRWWLLKLVVPAVFLVVGLALIAAVGVAQRFGWISPTDGQIVAVGGDAQQTYTCPMHPQIRQPGPGRCPICGMPLVPATAVGQAELDEFAVRITPAQRRLSNIQTADVQAEPLTESIETVGAIAIDESRMATIASYVDGRLERLFADYTGVDVSKRDHLAVVYSPELYAAQVEYVETRKSLRNRPPAGLDVVRQTEERLLENSRQKLLELGMLSEQIEELERTESPQSRLTIYTPIGGTVIEKMAVEGKYIKAGEPIYRVADLSTVWLMLELFPEDAARIRYGQTVEAEMQSLPGEVFRGRVAFIDPTVDERKRTVGVRVEFLNEDGRLRPGDYADATIYVPIGAGGQLYDADLSGRWISPMHPQIIRDKPGKCPICGMDLVPTSEYGYSDVPVAQSASIFVPRSAVLMAGNNSVVYVETEPGRFEIRPVTVGPILKDKVVILGGLEVGEHVATAGNFLIDSQMQLAGKPSLIDPTKARVGAAAHNRPVEVEHVDVAPLSGEAGEKLESLFAAYFAIQQSLAADQKPTEADSTNLHNLAVALSDDKQLPEGARALVADIASHSEHLHHMDVEKARLDAFRPISHAVVALASQLRGESAHTAFHHMFCPMVKGGGGDWLQATGDVANPYLGTKMPHCGERVDVFPSRGTAVAPVDGDGSSDRTTNSPGAAEDGK